ncbi:cell wall-binding repeat-containing protein [Clostridioides difficile]
MKCANKKILILSLSMMTILSSVGGANALEIKKNSNLEKQTINRTVAPELETLTMAQAFPDANFRAYLCNTLSVSDDDTLISSATKANIESIETLNVNSESIKDLSGINYFINLKVLYCVDNEIAELDLSNNSKLEHLDAHSNKFTKLNVTGNPLLNYICCDNNDLTSLDVSQNPELVYLSCNNNMLKKLDVSQNPKLNGNYSWANQRVPKKPSGGGSSTPTPIVTKIDSLVGSDRYDTSIKISKEGWDNADNVVLINSSSIPDALSATPFARAKNAPILLTQTNSLNQLTENEISRLGAKHIYIIGGFNSVDASIESYLKDKGLNIIRISGNDRYDTSIKLAKELNKENKLSKLVLVNGEKGLADAVSMGAISAKEKMPILLTNQNDDMKAIEELIDNKDISKSYVVGGDSLFNKDIEDKLPSVVKIAGEDRTETNSKVIDYFYDNSVLDNLYVAKNGENKEDDLVDALSVGVLAGKTESPVILVGDGIKDVQESLINKKEFRYITQIGGNGNEEAFSEIEKLVK